jgi:hypothetical protein
MGDVARLLDSDTSLRREEADVTEDMSCRVCVMYVCMCACVCVCFVRAWMCV